MLDATLGMARPWPGAVEAFIKYVKGLLLSPSEPPLDIFEQIKGHVHRQPRGFGRAGCPASALVVRFRREALRLRRQLWRRSCRCP